MNIVMLSPGYPAEMAYFTRALAGAGARVIGVGDQPPHALPEAARSSLAHYEHVNLADEGAVLGALRGLSRSTPRSTRWSASGSRTCSWRPASGRCSACPASPSSRPCRSGTRRR